MEATKSVVMLDLECINEAEKEQKWVVLLL